MSQQQTTSFWQKRRRFDFTTEAFIPEISIKKTIDAIRKKKFPIFISGSGDNPTAGSPEDNTNLLRLVDKMNLPALIKDRPVFAVIYDPEVVYQCIDSIQKDKEFYLGGKIDSIYSKPYKIKGRVEKIINKNGAIFLLFRAPTIDIIISSQRIGITGLGIFQDLGIDPKLRKIFIVKSGYLVDDLHTTASRAILSLTKGCTDLLLRRLPYKRLKQPIFPLDHV